MNSTDNTLFQKINESAHIFYGINYDNELFIQIATRDNEVAYHAEVPVSVNPELKDLLVALKSLFSDSFKELDIKIPRFSYSEWDGQRILKSGQTEIQECMYTQRVSPKFRYFFLSCLNFS